MSSMKSVASKFDSVGSVLNYLMEPSLPEVVSSTTTSTIMNSKIIKNQLKSAKKEKELAHVMITADTLQRKSRDQLPVGRVRYGPITVNPRRQPSKTLFTGRRSKYELLIGDEEEKRRLRRDRNRVAATKCREKRENVLNYLEGEHENEVQTHTNLSNLVQELQQRKQYLESLLSNQVVNNPLQINRTPPSQQPSTVFGKPHFLSSIVETQALPSPQLQFIRNDKEEFSRLFQPASTLTNSAFDMNGSYNVLLPEQQSIKMNSSSLERLINNLQTPVTLVDSNNNNCPGLYNSAYGSSTCAQQHSSSSEDDSLPPASKNHYVY